jgi:hypothetical protein
MGFSYDRWYRDNRSSLSRGRRLRYHTDEAYRKQCVKRASAAYRKRKRSGLIERTDCKVIRRNDGTRYFTIGKLSKAINKKIYTIRDYHRKGILPEPSFYDSRGWRLYSEHQVLLLKRVFRLFDEIKKDKSKRLSLAQLSEYVKERWNDGEDEEYRGERSVR